MKLPEIGDTVRIRDTHPGYDKGRIGIVRGYRRDGKVRVRIGNNIWVFVKPENLEVLNVSAPPISGTAR